ncbi:MAG: alanyl-tRNA synthetase [Stygiobacter sp.]|nr:MAG: alanyl-tRNA synthetase [Stygiobacter sp.]
MFTNAGMVQFKNVFTGVEKRDYVRAATSQKCVRAGGKHNDLDNVGYTARHHTFFEMLGNFSFGDYFKDDAISFAWNLITKEFGLSKDKLLVTVYHDDDEAFNIWKKVAGFSDDRIIRIPTSDNFWSMGDTGPCGPCSEIFYDHGDKIAGGPPGSPDQDGDRFIEIWNLVFMQFEQVDKQTRLPLPKPSIDTGMGLERLAAVLQGQHDNYDVDLLRALIEASAHESNTDPDGPYKVSHRVVADHLRSSCFLIADGVLPSNEGRGYVLRRIMRRAMRHAHLMGCTEPLLWRLFPALAKQMGEAYPELGRAGALITETLKLEETRFKATLDKGLKLLDDELTRLVPGAKLAGEVAFKLYDTYGFPLDLTEDALKAKGIGVDTDGFATAMDRQRAEARKAWSGSGEAATETLWFEIKEKTGASEFLGYDAIGAEGQIVALVEGGKAVEAVHPDHEIMVVANQTPFYGESGGQMGDTGVISVAGGKARIVVTDTLKKLGDLIVHVGRVEGGPVAVGEDAHFAVDETRRDATRGHHSATHLLHQALRDALGEHVTQKGSQVGPDRLRFDFAHPKGLSQDEIRLVEAEVNRQIRKNREVVTKLMSPDDAIEAGAMALFGEKYGEEVRVVSMGGDDSRPNPFSVELCGGTHVRRVGDIGGFKILSESAVAAGVRRVEAVTGPAFLAWANEQEDLLARAAQALKAAPAELPARIAQLVEDRRKLERELSETRKQLATGGGAGAATSQINGITYAGRVLDGVPAKDLKGMADEIKKQIGSGVVVLVSNDGGKASVVVAVTDDLTAKYSAVDLVRIGSEAVGGKGGGGRPDMAQAGGPDAGSAQDAVDRIAAALAG